MGKGLLIALTIVAFCVVLVFAGGPAYALTYTYKGANDGFWDDPNNWDNGTGASLDYPDAADAVVYVLNGNRVKMDSSRPDTSFQMQSLRTDGTSALRTNSTTAGGIKIYVGDVFLQGLSAFTYTGSWGIEGVTKGTEMYVSGNYQNKSTSGVATGATAGRRALIIMSGANKAYREAGYTTANRYCYNYLTVDGGSVSDNASNINTYDGSYQHTEITLKNGGYLRGSGLFETRELVLGASPPATPLQETVKIDYCMSKNNGGDDGTTRLALGGITYPGDVRFVQADQTTSGSGPTYLYKFKGGNPTTTTFNGNVTVGHTKRASGLGLMMVETRDNDTGNSINIHVVGNLYVGQQVYRIDGPTSNAAVSGAGLRGLLKCGSSQIDVDCNVVVGFFYNDTHATRANAPDGSIKFESSTIKVGNNWSVYRVTQPTGWFYDNDFTITNWDTGTSTVIFDGNGGSGTQTIRSQGTWFNNLTVNTLGTVKLLDSATPSIAAAGNMILKGNFRIEAGTFDPNKRTITFKGGDNSETGAQQIYDFNNSYTSASIGDVFVTQGSGGSAIKLLTNLMMDNLDLGPLCAVYLNGWRLGVKDDYTFVSSEITSMTWDQGTVFGTQEPVIPEPGTLLLLGTGILGLLGYIRRRRMK